MRDADPSTGCAGPPPLDRGGFGRPYKVQGFHGAGGAAPAEHQVEVPAAAHAVGGVPAGKGVDLEGLERDRCAALVGQRNIPLQGGDQPLIVRQGGEIRFLQIHRGGADPPEEIPVSVDRIRRKDRQLGRRPAGPGGDGVVPGGGHFFHHWNASFVG